MARYMERMEDHRRTGWRHEALHLLYRPASLGRQQKYRVRVPLLHRLHLVPGRWMVAACARYDVLHPRLPELDVLRQRAHP